MKTHPRRLAALLLLSACCFTHAAIYAATMASQPWVTNRIAEAEARVGERIVAATNAIPRADLAPATNYTDYAVVRLSQTNSVLSGGPYQTKLPYPTNAVPYSAISDAPQAVSVVAPSTNATAGTAADAKATGTALYTGFTEWEFSGELYNQSVKSLEWSDENERWEGVVLYSGTEVVVYQEGDKDSTSLSLLETDIDITATRHLITPTKTSQLVNDGTNGVPFAVETQLFTKQDELPYPTNAIPFSAIDGAPNSPSVFYDAAGGAATVSGATLTYQAASNSVGSVALLAGTNILHITAPSAIPNRVRDFGLTVTTDDAATITLDTSVSWRFDSASTNLSAGSWNRIYCTESPTGVFSLQLWTPDSAQEATP